MAVYVSAALLILFAISWVSTLYLLEAHAHHEESFVEVRNGRFTVGGSRLYVNGFNAYWFMLIASDPSQRHIVTEAFDDAAAQGLTVARTWAFNDGGYRALQTSPGVYNEQVFQALDFVVQEAARHGIRLVLSLVNNYKDFGGKPQYVQWGQLYGGQNISSEDDFFTNPVVRGYYKNHVETVLRRVNRMRGMAYRDDPTIFAWELINEPRCLSDLAGNTLQRWIEEMAEHVKSIDGKHLLEVGLEGFYGDSTPGKKKMVNPSGYQLGTDFILNHQVKGIDFATVHAYPDIWLAGAEEKAQISFLHRWMKNHIKDAHRILRMPVLFSEFGKSSKDPAYHVSQRDRLFRTVYKSIFTSARKGGSASGGLFWQLLTQGIANSGLADGYEILLSNTSSTTAVISLQSERLSQLSQ